MGPLILVIINPFHVFYLAKFFLPKHDSSILAFLKASFPFASTGKNTYLASNSVMVTPFIEGTKRVEPDDTNDVADDRGL
jgi:hypothetical protein